MASLLSSDEDSELDRRFFRCMESGEEEEEEDKDEEDEEEKETPISETSDDKRTRLLRELAFLERTMGESSHVNRDTASVLELEMECCRMKFDRDEQLMEDNKTAMIGTLAALVYTCKKKLHIAPGQGLLPDAMLPPNDLVKLARRNRSEETAEEARVHQEVDTLTRAYFKNHKVYKE